MLLCGSCFRHQTTANRLKTLCSLLVNGVESGKGKWCDTCGSPLMAHPDFTTNSLISAINRTSHKLLHEKP